MPMRPKLKAYKYAEVLDVVSFEDGDIRAPSERAWFLLRPLTFEPLLFEPLLGAAGSQIVGIGFIYAPYIPLQSTPTVSIKSIKSIKSRKLKAGWTIEAAQDLMAFHAPFSTYSMGLYDVIYNGVIFAYRNEYEQSLRTGFSMPGKKFKSILDAAVSRYINKLEVDDAAMDAPD